MQQIFEGTGRLAGVASRSWSKVVVTGVMACAVLAGCASGGNVTAADKQGTYVVSASATGGRLAWARAHKRAVSEATDYCESRGMQTSLGIEHTEGIEALQQQASVIRFECHPRT